MCVKIRWSDTSICRKERRLDRRATHSHTHIEREKCESGTSINNNWRANRFLCWMKVSGMCAAWALRSELEFPTRSEREIVDELGHEDNISKLDQSSVKMGHHNALKREVTERSILSKDFNGLRAYNRHWGSGVNALTECLSWVFWLNALTDWRGYRLPHRTLLTIRTV